MAAISEIKIDGFKAFPDEFTLDLKGKNLLLYGENGSGKSSIYYALHVMLQSQCKDKSKVYFDVSGPESIINKYTKKSDAKIEIKFEGSDVIYRVSKDGYEEFPAQHISPLRDLNGECVFINHKFLFHVFSFRNSQYIDLFPVFIKDILPFVLTEDKSKFISQVYDDIMQGIKRKGKSSRIENSYTDKISKFNKELEKVIEKINTNATPTASEIYNKYFKDKDDPELKITLCYDKNNDNIPQPDKSYQLRLGYRYQKVYIAGAKQEKMLSTNKEILQPVISLKIEEKHDETYETILKPQTYFNEAKLTAIALAIRFSILDTVSDANGRFMALDDMLISLDMSNRTKVVNYLLNIVSNKYKIYLFTHDKAFYDYICRAIKQSVNQQEWIYKTISYCPSKNAPLLLDSYGDYMSKAKHFYDIGDYETSAIYARKELEQSIGDLLPYELKVRADGGFVNLETLWKKLVEFYSNNRATLDKSMQELFDNSKLLILNVAAHYQRLSNPIYKIELEQVFVLIDYIHMLDKIEKKLIIPANKTIEFIHPSENYQCTFELETDLVVEIGDHIVSVLPKCQNIFWKYNDIEYYNFETRKEDRTNLLIYAKPKLTTFILNMPEEIKVSEDDFISNCSIEGNRLDDYLCGIKFSQMVKAVGR